MVKLLKILNGLSIASCVLAMGSLALGNPGTAIFYLGMAGGCSIGSLTFLFLKFPKTLD